MKEDKAPEKLYLFEGEPILSARSKKVEGAYVEYTRTDAFIEKVQSFLNKKDDRDYYTIGYIKRHLQEIIKEVGL